MDEFSGPWSNPCVVFLDGPPVTWVPYPGAGFNAQFPAVLSCHAWLMVCAPAATGAVIRRQALLAGIYRFTWKLPVKVFPLLVPLLVISATIAVPASVDASITLLPELNTLLLPPKESTPVNFKESLATDETFTLLLAFKFLMERLLKLLPEIDCVVEPASSMVPAVALILPAVAVEIVPAICIVASVTVSVAPVFMVIFLTVPVPVESTGIKGTPVLMVTSLVMVGTPGHQLAALLQLAFIPCHT